MPQYIFGTKSQENTSLLPWRNVFWLSGYPCKTIIEFLPHHASLGLSTYQRFVICTTDIIIRCNTGSCTAILNGNYSFYPTHLSETSKAYENLRKLWGCILIDKRWPLGQYIVDTFPLPCIHRWLYGLTGSHTMTCTNLHIIWCRPFLVYSRIIIFSTLPDSICGSQYTSGHG